MEKSGILAHSTALIGRIKKHPWRFGVAASTSVMAMAGAIAVSPGEDGMISITPIIEHLSLQGAQAISLGDASFLREERIQKGDTVAALLYRLGIQEPEAIEFIRTSPDTRLIYRQLAPGKTVVAQTSEHGDLKSLYFPINNKDSTLLVERRNGTLFAQEIAQRYETHVVMKSAEIRSSLFAATDSAGIPDSIASQLAEIFSGDIDFHRDLRKGDRFSLVYEMQYLRGQAARSGRILSAEFINGEKTFRAVYFEPNGKGGYYSPEGKTLKKAFLRSPLEFSRVTSGFAMRYHPVFQQWRAHKGVDYGAPLGTRVRATGDGIIDFVGTQGGYGNMIVVRHSANNSTAYGHLKGFASGLRKGSHIGQGDTIGYVGQSGWATGPHLHYEFRLNNQQVNPLAGHFPGALPLETKQIPRFKAQAAPWLAQLELIRSAAFSEQD